MRVGAAGVQRRAGDVSEDSRASGGLQLPNVLGDVPAEREAGDGALHADRDERGARELRLLGGGEGAGGRQDRRLAYRAELLQIRAQAIVHAHGKFTYIQLPAGTPPSQNNSFMAFISSDQE